MQLINDNCFNYFPKIKEKSIDLILCDPPYNLTKCSWDKYIPINEMWFFLNKIIKDKGVIALHSMQPFTTLLINSNIQNFKYCWIWDKVNPTGFLNANIQPLRRYEEICIFYKKQCNYNPVMTTRKEVRKNRTTIKNSIYNDFKLQSNTYNERYPTNIIKISNANKKNRLHPTQKPTKLVEYLIKTYTDERDIVLDFAMGSGTTGVACKNLDRKFIGIEKDKNYFDIAQKRIDNFNGDKRTSEDKKK
nr:DNA modification methylase (COG0863) [uncultured Mediterranean phage uvMED]BAR29222.1 DNA modification methylase (COG0863) [uncultured Mediterranean phage uvMED]